MPAVAGYDPNPSDNVRVECAFTTAPDSANPEWVDLTRRLDLASNVTITRGRADEFSVIQPASCSMTLDNNDGALTAGNTASPYYPNVKPHRKIRVSYRNPDVPGNLLTANQASMETDVSDWASNTAFGSLDTATISSSTVHPHSGTKGGLATWPTTTLGSMAWTLFSGFVTGRTYTASAWVWVPVGSPDVRMSVLFGANGTSTTTKGTFSRVSVTFTATGNGHFIGVSCTSATAGQLCYWDDVMVDEGSTLADFTLTPPAITYRFTGFVEEWPVEWPNGGAYAQAQISAVDRLARIGAKRPMRSVIEEAILTLSPVAYYPLGEPEGSTMAGDGSGSGSSPLSVIQVGAGGTLDFGTATGPPTDAMPAPTFTPSSTTNGKFLSGSTTTIGALNPGITLRANLLTSTIAVQTVCSLTDAYGSVLALEITAAGKLKARMFRAFGAADEFSITSSAGVTDGSTHDAAVTLGIAGGTLTATLYLDGVSVGTTSYASAYFPIFTGVTVGGVLGGQCFAGTIAHVAAFNAALTSTQVQTVCTATTTGFAGESSDARISRYADWAGIPSGERALDAGSSTSIAFTDTTGQSVLQAMQDIAATESGRLFVDGSGMLVLHARSRSYDNAAAVATIDANLLGAGSRFTASTFGLVNDLTGQRPDGPGIRAYDSSSQSEYGVSDPGGVTLLVTSDTEVADAVNWRVYTNSTPKVRIPLAEIDAYTDSTGVQAQIRALEIGDRITITGLPSSTAPASTVDLIVEGYTETIGLTGWTISANTSNYADVQALVLDDATYGLLDGDNRLIY